MSFQPTQISGCVLWLDAADPTTLFQDSAGTNPVTANGQTVGNWKDKSPQANNAVAGVSNQPLVSFNALNGQTGVNFSTINSYLSLTVGKLPTGSTSSTVFFVMKTTVASGNPVAITYGSLNINQGRQVYYSGVGNIRMDLYGANGRGDNVNTLNTFIIVSAIFSSTLFGWRNGTPFSEGTLNVTLNTGATTATLGNQSAGGSLGLQGIMCEAVIYTGSLSTFQRQQVEGYLAWKWGLQTNLPVTQPYRFFPPTSFILQSPTEFTMVRTNIQSGTLALPAASTLQGRFLTFKDISGTFFNSSFTLSTVGIDRFENGDSFKRLIEPYGYLTLASDGASKWYALDGTSLNTYTIGSLTNTVQTNALTLSTPTVSVGSFGLVDQSFGTVSSLTTQSTLLYLGSNVIGGSKVGPTLFLPTPRPFLPNEITSLRLWYDAADVNTVQLSSGNNISVWRDKSGFRYNAVQTTPANQPTYNTGNSVIFNGTSSSFIATDPDIRPTNVYMVMSSYPAALSGASSRTLFRKGVSGSTLEFFIREQYNTTVTPNQYYYDFFVASGTTNFIYSTTPNSNQFVAWNQNRRFILEATFTFGSPLSILIDGTTAPGTATGTPAGQNNLTSNMYIGVEQTAATYFGGEYNEVLMFNQGLSVSDRQKVEGYLAWKWGIVANLPASHPYKYTPP